MWLQAAFCLPYPETLKSILEIALRPQLCFWSIWFEIILSLLLRFMTLFMCIFHKFCIKNVKNVHIQRYILMHNVSKIKRKSTFYAFPHIFLQKFIFSSLYIVHKILFYGKNPSPITSRASLTIRRNAFSSILPTISSLQLHQFFLCNHSESRHGPSL